MNNYNLFQRKLHQIALSSQFMREATFDLDNLNNSSFSKNGNHVFITGLARSGTTILLNALYQSNLFASLSYADMPFVLGPKFWSMISFLKNDFKLMERSHGDGIQISFESPEAFEEVFWKTFEKHEDEELEIKLKIYLKNIMQRYKRKRYLSKNNQNIRRLELISKLFPSSKVLILFREPIQQAYSLLRQHKRFIKLSKADNFISDYMKWIGHTEFGTNYIPINESDLLFRDYLDINHWLEQWYLTYTNQLQLIKSKDNINLICYEKVCTSNDYWIKILDILQIENLVDFNFKESKKIVPNYINKKLSNQAYNLYKDLCNLKLR